MEEKGKQLGMVNLLGLGLGGAIGTGIFVMMGFAIAQTGRSIPLVCIVGCFFMLLAFWFDVAMSTMFVFKGGDYGMRTMMFGPLMTGVSAWLCCHCNPCFERVYYPYRICHLNSLLPHNH